jgi:IS30 family transposase
MGRFYNGFQIVGEDVYSKIDWSVFRAEDMYKEYTRLLKAERKHQDKINELIFQVESHRRMNSIQECLDELDNKAKVLKWLIHNSDITKYGIKDMHWLTKERICELYRISPKEFE